MHLFKSNMGDLVSAAFPVPDNPILLGTAQKTGLTKLGDLVAAAFPVPQNPILAATSMDRPKALVSPTSKNALLRSLTAAPTGPVANSVGMGDAASTLQTIGSVLDNNLSVNGMNIPYWVLAIGGLALAGYLMGGKAGTSRYSRFRAAHSAA